MDALFWGLTFGVTGKVILGVTVMMVHWKIVKEHKIDRKVLKQMRRERNLALLGIFFIVVGYYLELVSFDFVSYPFCDFVFFEKCAEMLEQI
jgi:hypothetical protein